MCTHCASSTTQYVRYAVFPLSTNPELGAVASSLPELKSWLQAELSKVGQE